MYTENNIIGLKVTNKYHLNKINEPGIAYTITETGVDYYHNHDLNQPKQSSYTLRDMVRYLNEGSWILVPALVTNNFPIY